MVINRTFGFAALLIYLALLAPSVSSAETKFYRMNEPVKGKGWIITVLSAKNEGFEITERFALNSETLRTDKPDTYLLRLKVELKSLDGEPVGSRYVLDVTAAVRDSGGKKYPYWAAGFPGMHVDVRKDGHQGGLSPINRDAVIDYIFTIPNHISVVDFIWKDFPPVRLKIE